MDRLNSMLDDICQSIGFTATAAISDWFGGDYLSVPEEAQDEHPIAKIIGIPAYRRLVSEFGGNRIWIPEGTIRQRDRRNREIATLVSQGKGSKEISATTGLTERRVQQIRRELEAQGILPFILAGKSRGKNTKEKAGQRPR